MNRAGMAEPATARSDYDIVLVADYFRSANAFLSILGTLGREHRIGLCLTPLDDKLRAKNESSQHEFTRMARGLGAEMLPLEGPQVRAAILLVLQRPYAEEVVAAVLRRVAARQCVGLLGLATSGLTIHDRFIRQFGIRKAYVPCRRLFDFLVRRRGAEPAYAGVQIEQMGIPFRSHRFIDPVAMDWLIAAPTSFSFKAERNKHSFLGNVIKLLEQIPESDVIGYKSHNSQEQDYFASSGLAAVANVLDRIPGALALARFGATHAPGAVRPACERVVTALLHRRVLRRAVPLSRLCPYEWVSLEAFLPGVRKGVIGGLSNTIWGTLYFGLPFYNCIDTVERQATSVDRGRGFKSGETLLDLNMEFFGVASCEGDLGRPGLPASVVQSVDLEGDLIDCLRRELACAASRATDDARLDVRL
jgi:hypothetical protein